MPRLNKTQRNKKALLEALERCYGNVTEACKAVKIGKVQGLNRTTFYNYVNDDPEFAEAVKEIQETAIDFVESKLFEKMEGIEVEKEGRDGEIKTYTLPPDTTALIFYLKTKGKKRGYVERQEIAAEVNNDEKSKPFSWFDSEDEKSND